ncbi:MAG: exonuclease, partial [Methanospirillum sp.]|nr:exonuclease [Methanospirillum sp.]
MQGADLVTVSQQWQARIAASPDFVVVPHDNEFRMGLHASAIGESTYEKCIQYLGDLCIRYEGVSLEEAVPGTDMENDEGNCYCIQNTRHLDIRDRNRSSSLLLRELRLVRGIGPKAAVSLKHRDCKTIPELLHHHRYRQAASHVLEVLQAGPAGTSHLIRTRLGPSHPLGLIASEGFFPDRIRYLDLETLGIFGRPVILFGVGSHGPKGFTTHQFILRDLSEEPAALLAVRNLLEG